MLGLQGFRAGFSFAEDAGSFRLGCFHGRLRLCAGRFDLRVQRRFTAGQFT